MTAYEDLQLAPCCPDLTAYPSPCLSCQLWPQRYYLYVLNTLPPLSLLFPALALALPPNILMALITFSRALLKYHHLKEVLLEQLIKITTLSHQTSHSLHYLSPQ